MPKKILVASPHPAFGELIRLSLEESGIYRVRLVQSYEQALQLAATGGFDLAILDCDLPTGGMETFWKKWMAGAPNLMRVIIPPDNDPDHPSIADFPAEAYLSKPFYLPDLMEILDELLCSAEVAAKAEPVAALTPAASAAATPAPVVAVKAAPPPPVEAEPLPPKAEIIARLKRLLPDVPIRAGVIVQGKELLASSGLPNEPVGKELAQWIGRTWNPAEPGDLSRYQRMSNGSEALFYARMLSPELVLGLACEASSPLSRVRHQAASLIHRLVEPLPSPVTVIPPEPPPSAAAADDEEALGADVQGELPDFNLAELLASMPSPDPEPLGVPDSGEWLPEETPDVQPPPATPSNGDEVTYALPWETGWDEETAKTVEINLPPNLAETVRLPGVAITRPINTDLSAGPVSSVTAGVTRPVFTCILLPARPEHYLTGEVAQWLAVTVPQMCHAFGWQIEGLTIQPSYLQWSVRLPPAVSPSYLVRLIRKQTSLALLQRFAVSGRSATDDFWAPGYLIISGADPIAPNMLRDFIAQTRRRQGLKIA